MIRELSGTLGSAYEGYARGHLLSDWLTWSKERVTESIATQTARTEEATKATSAPKVSGSVPSLAKIAVKLENTCGVVS